MYFYHFISITIDEVGSGGKKIIQFRDEIINHLENTSMNRVGNSYAKSKLGVVVHRMDLHDDLLNAIFYPRPYKYRVGLPVEL